MIDPFLEAIYARPRSDSLRLIWADALAESEEPAERARAEYIRLQCALARLPQEHPRFEPLAARERELHMEYGHTWAEPISDSVEAVQFDRGILSGIVIDAEHFLKRRTWLFRQFPMLRKARFVNLRNDLTPLARCKELARLSYLDLCGAELSDEQVAPLLASRYLNQLKRLDLSFNFLSDATVSLLVRQDLLPSLRWCSLSFNRSITSESAALLWDRMARQGVLQLEYAGNRIDDRGMTAWPLGLDCPLPTLHANPLGDSGALALARRPTLQLGPAKQLNLSRISLGADGLAALLRAPWFAQVRSLNLAENQLGEPGLQQLLRYREQTPRCGLQILNLTRNNLSNQQGLLLARSRWMDQLQLLDLSGNWLTQDGMEAIATQARRTQARIRMDANLGSFIIG